MRYLSTRDASAAPVTRSFAEVLLTGLAEDGGLYVPDRMPALSADIGGLAGLPYAELERLARVTDGWNAKRVADELALLPDAATKLGSARWRARSEKRTTVLAAPV